jgi:hypothetical protein
MVIMGVIAAEIWLLRQPTKRRTRAYQPVPRPACFYVEDDEPYESPLALVDDPEDERVEYALMDDLLDGAW